MKKTSLWILVALIAVVIALIIVFPHNPAHDLFLRYLVTISSWPIIILILMLILFFKFAPSIAELIRKPPRIKTGQFEIGGQEEAPPINKEGLEEIKKKYEEQIGKVKEFYLQVIDLERLVRVIYKSQFLLLKDLSKYKTQMPNMPSMFGEHYYKEHYLKSGGNPNYTFEMYINFLKISGLIGEDVINDAPTIKILPKGELFLKYCLNMAYSENIFFPV